MSGQDIIPVDPSGDDEEVVEPQKDLVVSENAEKAENTEKAVVPKEETPSIKRTDKIRVGMIDASSLMNSRARDIAEANLDVAKGELRGVGGMVQRVWKYNLAREYYRQKEIQAVLRQIHDSGTNFVDQAGGDDEKALQNAAFGAIVERFIPEDESLLHQESKGGQRGETREIEKEDSPLAKEIKDLILTYGANKGQFDHDGFDRERLAILKKHGGEHAEVTQADNFLQAALQVHEAIRHGEAIDRLKQDLEVVTGQARAGVRTEANLNKVDAFIEKLRSTRLGALVNESTLALTVAAVFSAADIAVKKTVFGKMAAVGTFGLTAVAGAGMAARREDLNTRLDRAQHARQMAQGGEIDPEHRKRRDEMETARYDMKGAGEITREIQMHLGREGALTRENIKGLLAAVVDADARIHLSDTQNIDLLKYSSPAQVEQERLALDRARAGAKVRIRTWLEKHPEAWQSQDEKGLVGPASLDTYLAEHFATAREAIEQKLGQDIVEKDQLFQKMKSKRNWNAAKIAFLTGITIGGIVSVITQETGAALQSDQQGVFETRTGDTLTQTPWASFKEYVFGAPIAPPHGPTVIPGAHGTHTESIEDWVRGQKGAVDIHRVEHYHNNTSPSDHNELRFKWGGIKGTGVDADGNYVLSIKDMHTGGSKHGSDVANLTNFDRLKVFLSASKGSQGHPFEIPVNPDGTVTIDVRARPELAKFLQIDPSGKVHFFGKYLEVAEVDPASATGGAKDIKVLSTIVGEGSIHTVETPYDVPDRIVTAKFTSTEPDLLVPGAVPIVGRTPLEKLKKPEDKEGATVPVRPPLLPLNGSEAVAVPDRASASIEGDTEGAELTEPAPLESSGSDAVSVVPDTETVESVETIPPAEQPSINFNIKIVEESAEKLVLAVASLSKDQQAKTILDAVQRFVKEKELNAEQRRMLARAFKKKGWKFTINRNGLIKKVVPVEVAEPETDSATVTENPMDPDEGGVDGTINPEDQAALDRFDREGIIRESPDVNNRPRRRRARSIARN